MVEKQSYLEYIWIMESIVLDDELSGCVVEEIRGIKDAFCLKLCVAYSPHLPAECDLCKIVQKAAAAKSYPLKTLTSTPPA